jgi:uncharacterized protein YggT (Ycf19 family)
VEWIKILTLVRLVSFMVLLYLALGWLVERHSRKPDSQLKAFFRLICSPITRPVARRMPKETPHQRVLAMSMGLVGAVWLASIALGAVVP